MRPPLTAINAVAKALGNHVATFDLEASQLAG